MTEHAPLVTILCAQCKYSRRAQVRRGEPLPEGWVEHVGLLSCSETCREFLQSMGLIPEECRRYHLKAVRLHCSSLRLER